MGVTDLSATPPAPGQFPNQPGYGRSGATGDETPGVGSAAGYSARPGLAGYGTPPQSGGYPLPSGYGPPDGARPVGAGVLGKRRNPFAVWLGLPIVTLGIYFFVWIYKTNKELSAFDNRIKVDPTLSVLAFLVGWLLIVPPFVAAWRLGERVRLAQKAADLPQTSTLLAFVLWLVGGGPLFLQFQVNAVWDRYPGAVEGQQVPLFN
jgi:hypothetical protein